MTAETGAALSRYIDAQPWRRDLSRRVQHYGYVYDYRARQVRPQMYLGPLPALLRHQADLLRRAGYFDTMPDQVIVNEYEPGQGIAPHTDCVPCFGGTIASISLLSACEMAFYRPGDGARSHQRLEANSLIVMSGSARYDWQHGIRPRRSDLVDGVRLKRNRRLSLTFRTVVL